MREIKFRAWDTDMREMVFVSGIQFEPHSPKETSNIIDQHNDIREMSDVILMQYTGLKDKNGKEIYEGDIIYNPESFGCICGYGKFTDSMPTKRVIKWDEREVQFKLFHADKNIEENSASGYIFCKQGEHLFEIIGNIYENPELLK